LCSAITLWDFPVLQQQELCGGYYPPTAGRILLHDECQIVSPLSKGVGTLFYFSKWAYEQME
jgi:hypothetical protein